MSFLNFFKKFSEKSEKKNDESPAVETVSEKPQNVNRNLEVQPEDNNITALVKIIMAEEYEAKIAFGRQNKGTSNERIYIHFKDRKFAKLFRDWYAALELREINGSEDVYELFLKSTCKKYGVKYPNSSNEPDAEGKDDKSEKSEPEKKENMDNLAEKAENTDNSNSDEKTDENSE